MKPLSQLKEIAKQKRPQISGDDLSGLIDIIVRQNEVIESAGGLCQKVKVEASFRGLDELQKEVNILIWKIVTLKGEVKK